MTKPDLLADVDGFFADFCTRAIEAVHEITGRHAHVKHDDIDTYAMEISLGLSPAEKAEWYAKIRSPGYCSSIRPYPGARECIAELQEFCNVYPVTYPFPKSAWWIPEREDWMRDELGLDPDAVIYTRRKYKIVGDFLLEDTTEHLIKWQKRHPNGVGIRMARTYNAREPYTEGYTVSTFGDVVRIVRDAISVRHGKVGA